MTNEEFLEIQRQNVVDAFKEVNIAPAYEISLRDQFAMCAMQFLMGEKGLVTSIPESAYEMADKMLEHRNTKYGPPA